MIRFPKDYDTLVPEGRARHVGQPAPRVDGIAKVTGQAQYAAEFFADGLAYGWVVNSAIARGRIRTMDVSAATALPGVLAVFTHLNRPTLARLKMKWKDLDAPAGTPFRPLHDAVIHFSGQPIALVVADSLELARHAATLLRIDYDEEPQHSDLHAALGQAREPSRLKFGGSAPPKPRGEPDAALLWAPVKIDAHYHSPSQHHNPMELNATTVLYCADGTLRIHDKTQGIGNSLGYVRRVFGLGKEQVRLLAPFVGGAFGSGLRPQHNLFLAVLAARELKCSVRVGLTRQQMFGIGYRPQTVQRVALGADLEGRLLATIHEAQSVTSRNEDYIEKIVDGSASQYQCEHVRVEHQVVELDLHSPLDMRAPGAAQGMFALESAMDELAAELAMDPLQLRIRNHAIHDQVAERPWSSRGLGQCLREGAARFGWSARTPAPRSMRSADGALLGWGMACGSWEVMQLPATARAVLSADGRLHVSSGTTDIGTGTATIMSQIAADVLGLPLAQVSFELGDSMLPPAPLQGGSMTAASVGSAVLGACSAIADALLRRARKLGIAAFAAARRKDVEFVAGCLRLRGDPASAVACTALFDDSADCIVKTVKALPNLARKHGYSSTCNGAVFVEVKVDELLGSVQVCRVVSAIAGGRILNPATARSQVIGSVVWGIGMALHEEAVLDTRLGRVMNHNLADYHIPVNADIDDIDMLFVDEHDSIVNPLGAKGLGEIGIVGVPAAVANAIFHATGRRLRELPITPDKVMVADF